MEKPGLDEVIILKFITSKLFGGMYWIEVAQSRERQLGTRECGNEIYGSIKRGEFLTCLETVSF